MGTGTRGIGSGCGLKYPGYGEEGVESAPGGVNLIERRRILLGEVGVEGLNWGGEGAWGVI